MTICPSPVPPVGRIDEDYYEKDIINQLLMHLPSAMSK